MTSPSTDRISLQWDDPTQSAESIIRKLAAVNELSSKLGEGLHHHCDMARIVGDDVTLDDVEKMLVNIARLEKYNGLDITKLHARYLRELKAEQKKAHIESPSAQACY